MYLNSIKGLHTTVQSTPYYKSKRPTAKDILIDRCNFVINSIVEGNRHNWIVNDYAEVPLHQSILKEQLGSNEYLNVLKLLKSLDIININQSYISQVTANTTNNQRKQNGLLPNVKAESKKYSLTDNAKSLGIIKVGILSKKTEQRLLKYKTKRLQTYLKDIQIHSKIFYNISDLHFQSDNAYSTYLSYTVDNPNKEQAEHYQKNYHALKRINTYTTTSQYVECSDFYYTQSKLVNRVFHNYSNMPKVYRKHLIHKDGSALAEIDKKGSQPFIIALNYIDKVFSTHNINIKEEGYKKGNRSKVGICVLKSILDSNTLNLLGNVLKGDFYKSVAECGLKEGDKDFYNLFINDYSKFKGVVLGEGLYFNLLPKITIKPAERYLLKLYPEFMEWVRSTKHANGYKSISIEAQKTESSLFINDLFIGLEHGKDFAVPIHDSIIVKADEVDRFKNKLITIFGNRFPILTAKELENLFTVTYY